MAEIKPSTNDQETANKIVELLKPVSSVNRRIILDLVEQRLGSPAFQAWIEAEARKA